ncbi:MAG: VPLPA-CTERM sorting domain-containing protein [Boseongicola sp.]|nr:MAG: VPLPA-CTERM sorting domain-containing protein [Boseongicola sp.]
MKLLSSAVAVLAVAIGTSASAATWDFDLDADAFYDLNGYEGTFEQVYGGPDAVEGSLSVSATASLHDGTTEDIHPFMDADGDQSQTDVSNLAGLGVCSSGIDDNSMSDCATGNPTADNKGDDNLLFPELLKLTFSESVWLRELYIRDASHDPMNGFIAIVTGVLGDDTHVGGLFEVVDGWVQGLEGAGFASMFWFSSDPEALNDPNPEIYLSTLTASVPLPAAGWLLLAGVGGLAATRRRGIRGKE